jgi:redox-sensing transcriptional repressor
VSRLSLYLRELQRLVREGQQTINSTRLGTLLGLTDAQVRKDLAHFGQFGYRGVGYRCAELMAEIRGILGTDRTWPVAIVGIGNLGRALLGYRGFQAQGFRTVAAFDIDAAMIGRVIEGIPIEHPDRLEEVAVRRRIRHGIITVPAAAAQVVADQMVVAGIVGILNFAPVTLTLPTEVSVVGVDLAIEMEQLAFAVANQAHNA